MKKDIIEKIIKENIDIKGQIEEILDSEDNLIGSDDVPQNNPNMTFADGTTDHNASIGHQHFGNDYMGRFGFYFYEGEEGNDVQTDLAKICYAHFQELIKGMGKNPQLFKKYRTMVEKPFESLSDEEVKEQNDLASKIMNVIKTKSVQAPEKKDEPLTESQINKIVEDIVARKKDTMLSKKTDNDILNKKVAEIKSLFSGLSEKEKDDLLKHLK